MTKLDEFKKRIFEPYKEAWEMIKPLSEMKNKDEKFWDDYMNKCDDFKAKYPSEVGGSIYRVLLDVGSEVSRIERQK